MSTETPIEPQIPEEPISTLSIDQPVNNPGPIVPLEYDGAEPSPDVPAEPVTTRTGKKLLRMDLGDGNVYTGETERELLQKVADGKREANRTIRELKERQVVPPSPAPSVTVVPRTPVSNMDLPDGYDHQTYLTMLGEDPERATRYMNRRLYGDIGDPVEALRYSHKVANQVEQQLTGAEFRRRNQDFPATEAAVNVLVDVMRQHNLPYNLVSLEWSYGEAKRQGRLTAPTATADGEYEYEDITFDTPQIPPPAAMIPARTIPSGPPRRGSSAPAAARGGGSGPSIPALSDADTMPLADLRALIDSKGGLRR